MMLIMGMVINISFTLNADDGVNADFIMMTIIETMTKSVDLISSLMMIMVMVVMVR